MESRTNFLANAKITLKDGTVLSLRPSDFTITNNSIVDGAGTDTFPLGLAISRSIQLEIANFDGEFSGYEFEGASIQLWMSFALTDTLSEKIEEGFFTVVEPATRGTTLLISAIDNMYKTNKPYTTNLTFPATIGAMLTDICSTCDIAQGASEFLNSDFVVDTMPSSDYTFRQIIGFIAMIASGNAKIDRYDKLQILSYDFQSTSINELKNWKSLKLDTDDITITGVSTILSDETILIEGTDGYVLAIDNPLISGKESSALPLIGANVINAKFRQFEGEHIGYPLAEFMDLATITDRNGKTYTSFISDVEFVFCNYTSLKNSADQVLQNGNKYPSNILKVYQDTKELIEKEKNEREVMVENLAKELARGSSMFFTEETQEDGGSIYYVHNKPTLEESDIVWKFTVEAIGISTDGGKTYPFGLDVSGMAVLERIYAVGINANYITTGAFVVKDEDGNIVFSADKDTGQVIIAALTAFRNELGEYLRIDPEEESISLGSSKNPIILKVINNRIAFTQSGEEIAWFSDNQLHTKQLIVTEVANLCGLIITKDDAGDIFLS